MLTNSTGIGQCRLANTVKEGCRMVDQSPPDLLILDLALPDGDGQEVAVHLLDCNPRPLIILLSAELHDFSPNPLLLPHIRAIVDKSSAYKDLAIALSGLVDAQGDDASEPIAAKTVNTLTIREQEVYLLIGNGMTSKQIANKLHISLSTVETHRKAIAKHLGTSGVDLVRHASVHLYRTENESITPNL
jgi:DNA-binding NarL/FixJ family response regulator